MFTFSTALRGATQQTFHQSNSNKSSSSMTLSTPIVMHQRPNHSHSNRQQHSGNNTALFLLAPTCLALFLANRQQEDTTVMGECYTATRAEKIRGNYENKIRFFSPPEKSFEIFSSEKTEDGELRMSYKDFLHSMTPYTYTSYYEDQDEYLKEHKPAILQKVDVDGDGQVSFTEYFFFLVLLQSSDRDLRKVFKKYEDKETKTVSKDKMGVVLRELRKSTQAGSRQQDRVGMDPRAIKANEEDFKRTNAHLVQKLFADTDTITARDIIDLQYKFREDLWHYQFFTLEPNDKDRISTGSLLSSKLCDVMGSNIEKFRLQIKKLSEEIGENDPGVSVEEFIAFQIFFERIDFVKARIFRRSFLDYDEFKDLFYEIIQSEEYVKKYKVKVPEHVCQALFGLLDIDGSGELEPSEVLQFNRNMMGKPMDQQAKDDAAKKLQDFKKQARQLLFSMTGIQI